MKPAIERSAALVLLVVVAPVLAVCAIAIRCTLGRGVLYRQQRIGLNGKPFTVLKFRTMEADRRKVIDLRFDGPERRRTHKSDSDPRHTRFGRFLRKWSLDELPQLWNVVRGDMALVGPRPELVAIVDRVSIPGYHDRHLVRPGLTGLWQVTARGDGTPMQDHVADDLAYVQRVSFLLDLRILVLTVPAVLGLRPGE